MVEILYIIKMMLKKPVHMFALWYQHISNNSLISTMFAYMYLYLQSFDIKTSLLSDLFFQKTTLCTLVDFLLCR